MTRGHGAPEGRYCRAGRRGKPLLRHAFALLVGLVPAAALADTPRFVVTRKPIHSLVARVMEGVGEPLLLVDGKASPHSFSLRPSQVQAVGKADVFIRVSERLEPFTGKLVRALPA